MRIAIDARMMGAENTRGIGRYIHELIGAMLELRTDHCFVLLHRDPERSPFFGHDGVEHIRADVQWYTFAEQLRMPMLIKNARADLLHVPHWNVPFLQKTPFIVTIHDLLLLHQQASAKASTRSPFLFFVKQLGYRAALLHAAHRSRAICVPTEFVKNDLVESFHTPPGKIVVTGEGLSALPEPDVTHVPSSTFLFYVGSAYPHKRLDLLLDGWATLASRHMDMHLVIAGEKDVFMNRHESRVREQHLPRVDFVGRLTDAELAGFFSRACLFIFPTSHEGFGLPPIEALSQGCPVVASDIPPLREVLPQSGVSFFREGDVNDMIRNVEAQLARHADAKRGAHAGGQEVRERHRWLAVAERTIHIYERACHSTIF